MKSALISPNEPRESGYRIADIADVPFEVASPMFWIECSDTIKADLFWYDPSDSSIKETPYLLLISGKMPQPVVYGAQTL